jgi:four helix bundle protein
MSESSEKFLQKTGNHRALHAYRKAEVIYDFTFRFCEKLITKGDRTRDQMIQAARSGKQNIAEGSKASVTSTETEVKLMNVARASLEELLIDYQDFLRVRDLPQWAKSSSEALSVRKLTPNPTSPTTPIALSSTPRQYRRLPHRSCQLPPRPIDSPPGEGLRFKGRPPRTHDPRPHQPPRKPTLTYRHQLRAIRKDDASMTSRPGTRENSSTLSVATR